MLRRPWCFLVDRTGWPAVAGLLVLFFVYVHLFFTPRSIALKIDAQGNPIGDGLPDGRMSPYSAQDIQQLFARWHPAQLTAYQISEIREDGLFPLIVACLFAVLLANAFRGVFGDSDQGRWLLLLPVALLIADYSENLRLYWAVEQFRCHPDVPPSLAEAASPWTMTKWMLVALNFLTSIAGIIWSRCAGRWPTKPLCAP